MTCWFELASDILSITLVADQLIVSGKSREEADELATKIWLALLDNLEDTKHTFMVLKSVAQEYDVREKQGSFH